MTNLNDKMTSQNSNTTIGTTAAASVGLGGFVAYGLFFKVLAPAAATGATTVMGPALLVGGALIAISVNQALKADMMITEIN